MYLSDLVTVENRLGVAVHGGVIHLVELPLLAHHESLPEEQEVGQHHDEQHVAEAGQVEHEGLHLCYKLQVKSSAASETLSLTSASLYLESCCNFTHHLRLRGVKNISIHIFYKEINVCGCPFWSRCT